MSPESNLLKKRAASLREVRSFFLERDVLEADVTHLLKYPQIDAHIDVMRVELGDNKYQYLHTSPEYELKKLLAKTKLDIYAISKVYRKKEEGRNHSLEFTMIEWYRVGFSLDQMIKETLDLIRLFIPLSFEVKSYQELFTSHLQIDPFSISDTELEALTRKLTGVQDELERDDYLDLLFSHEIQPHLQATVVRDFPSSQAALAEVRTLGNIEIALRFEVFIKGIELANGYFELRDSTELKRRFNRQNSLREQANKESFSLDNEFLKACDLLPSCSGVSIGFDRLLMLYLDRKSLSEVLF